jgi:hypothetical protein
MDNDIKMDDGNGDVVPTPVPKLKSTIMGFPFQLDGNGPDKMKTRGFRK